MKKRRRFYTFSHIFPEEEEGNFPVCPLPFANDRYILYSIRFLVNSTDFCRVWGAGMQDMIKRIIEMDEKARQITEEARLEKQNSEQEIAQKAQELRTEYLEKARRRIRENVKTERAAAEQKWEAQRQALEEERARLERTFADQKDGWVDEIVRRVLS